MQTTIKSHIREQLYEAFKNAIIQSPKYLEAGGDIYELKRMMGHSAIKTTSGYIHISKEHLQSVRSPLDTL